MSDVKERLKKLLDGDLEASDIAEDAALVSLADRLYGIKIANVKPVKAREMENQIGGLEEQPQQVGQTPSLMVEVIEPAAAPLPDLPHLAMPDLPTKKAKLSPLVILSVSGLLFVLLNLFGMFSSLFESSQIIIDLTITVDPLATVINAVALVDVKSTFEFLYV